MKNGIELIAEERQEQINKHNLINDSKYENEELRQAAIYCLTLNLHDYPLGWDDWFLLSVIKKKGRMQYSDFRIEMDKIAAALLAADIDLVLSFSNS